MFLFDSYTFSNIINESLYFNEVNNFDDPVDAAFTILTGGEAPERNELKIKELFEFNNIKADPITPLVFENMFMVLELTLKKYIGVSCFTKQELCCRCGFPSLNPLMLSSYANKHTGIVIEYQAENEDIFKKIQYNHEYKHFRYDEILNNINFKNNISPTIEINDKSIKPFLFKFDEWEYQNEYRIFDQPNKIKPLNDLGLKITRVFFGCNANKNLKNAMCEILSARKINFFLLQTPTQNNDRQRVIIYSPDGRKLNCHLHCQG